MKKTFLYILLLFIAVFGIGSLIFWGLGSLILWIFKINYVWTFWHGLACELVFTVLKQIFGGK